MIRLPSALLSNLLVVLASSHASAQEDKITLEPREKWTNVAADTKADFHFTVKVPRAFKGRVAWAFADAGTKQVFAQGRGVASLGADVDKPAPIKITLVIPAVKAGVILQAQLVVSIYEEAKTDPAASYQKTLWIFPADPFADQTKWLKELRITLYDSDPRSKTAHMLKELQVPFEEIRNLDMLADLKEGLLLVGEGISFKAEEQLLAELAKVASRGLPVLCLAPADGSFPLPVKDNGFPAAGKLTMQGAEIITQLDKRLDASAWAPDNQVVAASLALKAENNKAIVEVQEGDRDYSWLQLEYPDRKGRLVVCGFGLVRQWEASRTPRFLLARLFEHVTEGTATESKK